MISFVLKPPLTFLDATFGARLMVRKDVAIPTLLSPRHIHIPVLEGTGSASGWLLAAAAAWCPWVHSSSSYSGHSLVLLSYRETLQWC